MIKIEISYWTTPMGGMGEEITTFFLWLAEKRVEMLVWRLHYDPNRICWSWVVIYWCNFDILFSLNFYDLGESCNSRDLLLSSHSWELRALLIWLRLDFLQHRGLLLDRLCPRSLGGAHPHYLLVCRVLNCIKSPLQNAIISAFTFVLPPVSIKVKDLVAPMQIVLTHLAFFFLCKGVAIGAGVSKLSTHWPLSELSDLILPTHLSPYSFESGMRIEVVLDKVLSEPFEVCQAMEVRVEATLICCHECEESGIDEFFLHVNGDLVGEYLL